jgi:hypothetical protein
MARFLFAVVFSGGAGREEWVEAESEKLARKKVWAGLGEAERDACESIECIDEVPA